MISGRATDLFIFTGVKKYLLFFSIYFKNATKRKCFREKAHCRHDLGHQGGGGGGDVLPGRGKGLHPLVVPSKTVDTGLDQDETELGVLVSLVSVQVLTDGHGLLDEGVQVLRELRGTAVHLQDPEDLASRHVPHLRDTKAIPQGDTNLTGRETLLRELGDVLDNVVRLHLHPGRSPSTVRQRRSGNTLTLTVHAPHDCEVVFLFLLLKKVACLSQNGYGSGFIFIQDGA